MITRVAAARWLSYAHYRGELPSYVYLLFHSSGLKLYSIHVFFSFQIHSCIHDIRRIDILSVIHLLWQFLRAIHSILVISEYLHFLWYVDRYTTHLSRVLPEFACPSNQKEQDLPEKVQETSLRNATHIGERSSRPRSFATSSKD